MLINIFYFISKARSTSWRENEGDERTEGRGGHSWHEGHRSHNQRWTWDEDHLPEWATENSCERGGTFDTSGAFLLTNKEQEIKGDEGPPKKQEAPLQKSLSQQNITQKTQHPHILTTSQSATSLVKPSEGGGKKNEEEIKEKPAKDKREKLKSEEKGDKKSKVNGKEVIVEEQKITEKLKVDNNKNANGVPGVTNRYCYIHLNFNRFKLYVF